jgi:plastocyanin
VDVTAGKPLMSMPARSLDQNGCTFQPHVLVIPVGKPLKVQNSDGILHNIHTYSVKNPPINSAHPGSMPEVSLGPFTTPEVIKVMCDVHSWMSCWVWVASHPYVTVSSPGGAYRIPDLRPGKYRVEAWHETLGTISSEVTIAAGRESRLDFAFPARPAKAQPTGAK